MSGLKAGILLVVAASWATCGQAAVPDLADTFDNYAVGQQFVVPTNGWQASSDSVMATNNTCQSSPNSVVVARQSSLTNTVNGGSDKVIWTDCYVKPTPGEQPPDLPVNEASFVGYFNTNGYLEVATSSSGWTICSNDIWDHAIAPAASGFVRVTVYQNYTVSNMAVFVNGQLAIQDLRFVGSSATYNSFSVMSQSSNAWVDNVWIKTNYDSATLTTNLNGDGLADAAELAAYGYAARTVTVGSLTYPTLQSAINVWRARDTVSVPAGTYASENIVVSNAITFAGGAFTNAGSLTVRSAAAPAFQGGMNWGTITIDSNALATFGQPLACSNLIVRSGATATVANVICSNLTMESGALLEVQGSFACSGVSSLAPGALAIFSNSASCPGTVALAASSALHLAQGALVGSLYCTGSVVLSAGQLSVATLAIPGMMTVAAGATTTVSTAMSLPVGGHLDFTQAVFLYPAVSVDLGGTFSLSNNWGQNGVISLPAGANGSFHQSLTNPPLSSFDLYQGATAVVQDVTCTNLMTEDHVTLTALGVLACVNSLVLGADNRAGFSNTVSCGGVLIAGTNSTVTFGAAVGCSNLTVRSGATVVVASLTCSNLVVEPGAHFSCLGPFQCAGVCSFATTSTGSFGGTMSCSGALTIAAGASVTLSQDATLGSLSVDGSLAVASGASVTLSGSAAVAGAVTVASTGTLTINSTLTVSGSGALAFTNARLVVPSSSVDMNGTFSINNTWGQPAPTVPLPLSENFESYSADTPMNTLAFNGWGATSSNVVVQSSVANAAFGGSKAMVLPVGTLVSNRVSTGVQKIWTDCYLRPALGGHPFAPPTNEAGFVAFADTNGWLEVATSNGWDICSNLVAGGQADRMTTSTWTRITVCQNLTNNTVAVFINGKLARQLMKAPGSAPNSYSSFSVDNWDGQAYLDDVSIAETWPTSITTDMDHDQAADAYEVDLVGSMTSRSDLGTRGTLYIMR